MPRGHSSSGGEHLSVPAPQGSGSPDGQPDGRRWKESVGSPFYYDYDNRLCTTRFMGVWREPDSH